MNGTGALPEAFKTVLVSNLLENVTKWGDPSLPAPEGNRLTPAGFIRDDLEGSNVTCPAMAPGCQGFTTKLVRNDKARNDPAEEALTAVAKEEAAKAVKAAAEKAFSS